MWIRKCAFKLPLWVNLASQCSQAYCFSPVWIRKCSFKWLFLENFALQYSQAYGFSSQEFRKCLLKVKTSVNLALQCSQTYGFSPVCFSKCFFKLPASANIASDRSGFISKVSLHFSSFCTGHSASCDKDSLAEVELENCWLWLLLCPKDYENININSFSMNKFI